MNGLQILNRNAMKKVLAGSDPDPGHEGGDSCYLTCSNCSNSTCQGEVSSCSQSNIWQMCGSHDTGWTCTCF